MMPCVVPETHSSTVVRSTPRVAVGFDTIEVDRPGFPLPRVSRETYRQDL